MRGAVKDKMNQEIDQMNKRIAEQIEALPKKHKSLVDLIKKEEKKIRACCCRSTRYKDRKNLLWNKYFFR
ncbi:hypothetical protein [Clostridium beijerinckii]|uniref:hypothetical protein n=1 Tax=Clostridium beijerinckii TaxID=1520 RepID=UPI00232E6C90|nr:hypothetical protein [Clostridium beijerinckii]